MELKNLLDGMTLPVNQQQIDLLEINRLLLLARTIWMSQHPTEHPSRISKN
jgi:hypothetical protein